MARAAKLYDLSFAGSRLEGISSGYWTPPAKRSSGLNQPLGFNSLALRSALDHSSPN